MKTRILLLALLVAGAAAAQEPSRAEPVETFYETATVRERPLSSATATVTVLEREEIEASGARTVGELLRRAPGVDVTSNGTRGGFTAAQIRGGDPNFTLVLLDGVPLNDATYPVGDVFNLEGLPATGVERIEIVRGPLSSVYGSTGLAGVVHIRTRLREPNGEEDGEPVAAVAAGAGDAALRQASGSLSGGLARGGAYAVHASFEEEEGRIADERFEQGQVLGNLSLPLGGSRLELRARHSDWRGDDYPEASGGPVYGSGELRRSDHRESSLSAELSLGQAARHRLSATVYRHGLGRESPAIFPAVPPSVEETAFTSTRLGWSSVLWERGGSRWSGGVDVQREEGENRSLLLLPPEFGGEVPGDYEIERTLPGAYTELVLERGDLTFEAGSRLDLPEDRAAQWSPRLGIGWRLSSAARLHASAGRAWKLPSFFALASPPQLGGNPDLRPETVLGGDLGADWQWGGGRADAGLTLFYNRFEDLIDFDFESFTHLNRSAVEARGVEASLGWRPAAGLSVHADATWQRVEDRDTGAELRHRPEWSGGARLRWQPRDPLALELDARAVSRQRDEQIPVPEIGTVPGYETVGLAGSWRFAGGWRLEARVENLLDREYETLVGFPGPGRSARIGLGWSSR